MSFEFVRVDFDEANTLSDDLYVFVGMAEGKLIFKKRVSCVKPKLKVKG